MLRSVSFVLLSFVLVACSAGPDSMSTDLDGLGNSVPKLNSKNDNKGDDQSGGDTVSDSLFGFGGMYSLSGYNNPATGSTNCPGDYESVQFLGSQEEDAGLYYCKKTLADGESPIYHFGGFYGYHSEGIYKNPVTGAASCPANFTSYQIYGYELPEMNYQDFRLYFCGKSPAADDQWAIGFGGFYGEARNEDYDHVLTQDQTCPQNHESFPMLGSSNADWPAYACLEKLSSSAKFYEVDDQPEIEFYPVFDRGLVAFGGMFSLKPDSTPGYPNPIMAGKPNEYSCPAGYLSKQVYGNQNAAGGSSWRADWSVFVCYKDSQGLFETAKADFGGMYGVRLSSHGNFLLQGSPQACPTGFQASQITGQANVDWGSYFCWREQERGVRTPYSFGGLYAPAPAAGHVGYVNPLTNANFCPADHGYPNQSGQRILDQGNIDRPLFFCGDVIDQ